MKQALTIAFFVATSPALAMSYCSPREQSVKVLETKYHETLIWQGVLSGNGGVLELFVSKGGTWTVLSSDVNGLSCFMASGDGGQAAVKVPERLEDL